MKKIIYKHDSGYILNMDKTVRTEIIRALISARPEGLTRQELRERIGCSSSSITVSLKWFYRYSPYVIPENHDGWNARFILNERRGRFIETDEEI